MFSYMFYILKRSIANKRDYYLGNTFNITVLSRMKSFIQFWCWKFPCFLSFSAPNLKSFGCLTSIFSPAIGNYTLIMSSMPYSFFFPHLYSVTILLQDIWFDLFFHLHMSLQALFIFQFKEYINFLILFKTEGLL